MRLVAVGALVPLLLAASASASDWQSVLFAGKAPAKTVHYRARVLDQSHKTHTVEAWRQPNRLRRSSDGVLDLYATRRGGSLATVLVDKRSGRLIRADEGVLLRAGHAAAWSELAHVLVRPAGGVSLSPVGQPRRIAGAICQPYRATRLDQSTFTFCWSSRLRLPLRIDGPDGRQSFVVDFVEERRAPPGTFVAPSPAVTDRTDDD